MMSERLSEKLLADFPRLNPDRYRITSPATKRYNCVAWAAGENTFWWWPNPYSYWPRRVPRQEHVTAFVCAFETLGYTRCGDGTLEHEFEKIALFGKTCDSGVIKPTHAARQLESGRWTSKLGRDEDIEHLCPEDLNGPGYGEVVQFMRRPRPA